MFIRTDENNNIITYPYSLEQFRADYKNVSFPQTLSNRLLAAYNVYPVLVDAVPEVPSPYQFAVLDVENPHRTQDGEWRLSWYIADKSAEQIAYDLEKAKTQKHADVNAARDHAIFQTLMVAVSDSTTVPVDLRQNTPDIQNISGLTQSATLQKLNDDTTPIEFRGADNVVYTLTPDEMIVLGKAVASKYSQCYKTSWTYKDQIAAATNIEQVNDIIIQF